MMRSLLPNSSLAHTLAMGNDHTNNIKDVPDNTFQKFKETKLKKNLMIMMMMKSNVLLMS